MTYVIEITRDNLDQLAKGLAASVNRLGFRKNGKEMVASQAIRILAERLGMNEHALVKNLNASGTATATSPESPALKSPMQQAIEALETRWGHEHGWYGREEWQEDVAQGNTRLGYWEWVQHSIEGNGDEEEHCSECGKPLEGASWDGLCGDCADQVETFEEYKDEAESLGINFEDVKFWVQTHYKTTFEAGSHDRRMDWLHGYRQFNGMTPVDSSNTLLLDTASLFRLAYDEYYNYDFGEDVVVVGDTGWEWAQGQSLFSKKVFLQDIDAPDAPSRVVVFRVNIENGRVTDVSCSQ